MTREEKCLLAIEKGFTYNPETGKIYGIRGKQVLKKHIDGYIQISFKLNKKKYYLLGHHFAWYCTYNTNNFEQLDHINGIRYDNRIQNLREVSNKQNCFNRNFSKKNIGVKGYFKLGNKYRASISNNSKTIHIGVYNTEQEAREAYLKAKEKYHVI